MVHALMSYLPQDRRQALVQGRTLPTTTSGTALFADISGFTPLTEALTRALGQRRGIETLTDQINAVYTALIAAVDAAHGSVISFAGDAITCWFDAADGPAPARAAACALAMQQAMRAFQRVVLPDGTLVALGLKVAIASGPAQRFVVGDPERQLYDTLAGATVARMAAGEHLAERGEVLIDAATAAHLAGAPAVWRTEPETGERFALLDQLDGAPPGAAWPALAPESVPLEQLRPWLLPATYQREVAGQGAFLTELRPVVALFLRFSGIDYDRDPAAGATLDAFMRSVQQVLARYDGTLLQLTIGDKGSYLYAAFGAPVAHEDDALRATLAAHALQQALADHPHIPPPQIGITQGTMRCGAYGSASRRTYGVLGDDVNLAARLMALALPGETLVTGGIQAAVAAKVVLDPRGPLRVKGKAEPLPVFVVREVRQGRAIRLQEPRYALPMAGRAAELALVAEALSQALAGQAQLLAISAEAGLGKSRLVAEGIRLARQRGMVGYGGAAEASGTRTPYLVWQPIWRALFDIDPEAAPRRQQRALERRLDEWVPERMEALPLLGPLLGLALPDNDFTRRLEPKDRQGALHALLSDCLTAAAREAQADGAGLLLVLEDTHWIDPASDALLHDLAQAIASLPVLLILAYRPTEQYLPAAHLDQPPHVTMITLSPLDASESEQLIRAKLAQLFPARSDIVPTALVEQLTARAQGNPFYLEELLNYLHDRAIDPRDTEALGALDLPDSLHRLILSRIDGLSPHQQVTLRLASVVGRRFRVAWLQGAFQTMVVSEALQADIAAWVRSELTQLDTPEPELAYVFKQIVTHEVAYASLARATQALLHGQIAAYLEQEAADNTERYLDILAYHYEQSDHRPKALEYLRRAGVAAAERFANDAALAYLSRALELVLADDTDTRYALLLAREAVYEVQGARGPQAADLAALADLAGGDPARQAEVALRRGRHAERTGDYPAALAAFQLAVAQAQIAGLVALAATGHQRWGWVLLRQRRYTEAREQLDRSLELAATLGDWRQSCLTLNDLGGLEAEQGVYIVAQSFYEQSLALARELGDRRQESYALSNLGAIFGEQGDLSSARAYLEQSLTIAHAIGDRQMMSLLLGNLGFTLANLGDYAAARRSLDQSLQLTRAIGDRQMEAYTLGNCGVVLVHQGAYQAAEQCFAQSLALAQALGDTMLSGWAQRGLGSAALGSGDLAAAAELFLQSAASLRQVDNPALVCEPLAGLARVALARQDAAAALGIVEEILAHLAHGTLDGAEEPMLVYLTCYQALHASADPRAAAQLARAHTELHARAARIPDAADRHAFLTQVAAHREIIAAWDL